MALPKTLAKSEKRRIKAEIRVAFSLDTFFWPNKRKYLGCRAETRHINSRRDSDTKSTLIVQAPFITGTPFGLSLWKPYWERPSTSSGRTVIHADFAKSQKI